MVGYISYDTVKLFEKVPDLEKPSIDMPDIFLMIPETVLIFDNLKQSIKIVYNAFLNSGNAKEIYEKAQDKIETIIKELKNHKDERFRSYLYVTKKTAIKNHYMGLSQILKKRRFYQCCKKKQEIMFFPVILFRWLFLRDLKQLQMSIHLIFIEH